MMLFVAQFEFKIFIFCALQLQELAQRKAKVLATLQELQNEVAPITYATEKLKDTDHMKDSKSFISILQKEYNVRFVE